MLDAQARNVVVIGASAGGVEALKGFFSHLGPDVPAAFFVVLHMSPHTPSALDQVLSAVTAMPVIAPRDGDEPRPGSIYVPTVDRHLMLGGQGIRITRGPRECRVRPAVDCLFRSAASAHGNRVTGVVLSGALDDGTAGLWAIKDCAGTALVQAPSEALYDAMPRSAIRHVDVDFVGPVEALARQVAHLVGTPLAEGPVAAAGHPLVAAHRVDPGGVDPMARVARLGTVPRTTCPVCNGFPVECGDGPVLRLRCRADHDALSLKTLVAEVNDIMDDELWDALQAVEERILLLRRMGGLASRVDEDGEAARCLKQAADAEARLKLLRNLVLDPMVFGRGHQA